MRKALVVSIALHLVLCIPLWAENRLFFEDETVPAGGTGVTVFLKGDNDVDILGFSFGLNYDQSALTVTSVTIDGTVAAGANFFDGRIDDVNGVAGYGCVMDWSPPLTKYIPMGTNRLLAKISLNVLGAAGTTTQLVLETVTPVDPEKPDELRPVKNAYTDPVGKTIVPTVRAGTLTIEDRTPAITNITLNSGVAGDVFHVVGDFFGEPGLAVTVCSSPAELDLQSDGRTLHVTAPDCGTVGAAEVKVCTVRGCDSEPAGFTYEDRTPVIQSISDGTGLAGHVFAIEGEFFGEPGLAVTVCSATAAVSLQGDGRTLHVTAPDCEVEGDVEVKVCTVRGCDSDPAGFTYLPGDLDFIRGDSNNDTNVDISDGITVLMFLFIGGITTNCKDAFDSNDDGLVDLSDGVFIFNFLFTGGPRIPAPYPQAGKDETQDTLPRCLSRP